MVELLFVTVLQFFHAIVEGSTTAEWLSQSTAPPRKAPFIHEIEFRKSLPGKGILTAGANREVLMVINFGNGVEISIADLASAIGRLLGKELTLVAEDDRVRPENSEVERLCADATKACTLLGWKPQIKLEEGLRQTIAWIEPNLKRYRVNEYSV